METYSRSDYIRDLDQWDPRDWKSLQPRVYPEDRLHWYRQKWSPLFLLDNCHKYTSRRQQSDGHSLRKQDSPAYCTAQRKGYGCFRRYNNIQNGTDSFRKSWWCTDRTRFRKVHASDAWYPADNRCLLG